MIVIVQRAHANTSEGGDFFYSVHSEKSIKYDVALMSRQYLKEKTSEFFENSEVL